MCSYANGVTVGIVREGALAETAQNMEERHSAAHDTLVLFVPQGLARDARDRIWAALDTAPTQPAGEFERDQALAYEGNIARMFGSL